MMATKLAKCLNRGCGRDAGESGYCSRLCLDEAAGIRPREKPRVVALAKTAAALPKKSRLAECEATIERYFNTWIEAAEALEMVKNDHLYREAGHASFGEYCKERWSRTRQWAYDQIEGLTAYRALLASGKVSTEFTSSLSAKQSKAVAKVERELGPEAFAAAVERAGPKPNAAALRNAAQPVLETQTVIEERCSHARKVCADCGAVL